MKIQAFKRKNGDVGIRNHLLIMPSVVCANNTAQRISAELKQSIVIPHQNGCAEIVPADREYVRRTLIGFGSNSNVGACLVVGLGCEDIKAKMLADNIAKTGKPVRYLNVQDCGGTTNTICEGVRIGQQMLRQLSGEKRVECDLSDILLGLECGGSDTFSGLSANPAIGRASDKLIALGGTALLSETPEHMGGEELLLERMVSQDIKNRFMGLMDEWERIQKREDTHFVFISLGNMDGGLSTLEEKALGCVLKAGTSPIQEVLEYSQTSRKKGLVIMDSPGADVESMTGMAAGGAQLMCFSTGRGTPTACPIAPTIKISSNTQTFRAMEENIDLDAGRCLSGETTIQAMGEEIFNEIINVCNGKQTKAEMLGFGDFAIMTRSFTY